MQYKTIALELLKVNPTLHEQLRTRGTLLATMERCAESLKASHEAAMQRLHKTRPGSDPRQIASEALEFAIAELEEDLCCGSRESGGPTLDGAMAYLRRHTPTA